MGLKLMFGLGVRFLGLRLWLGLDLKLGLGLLTAPGSALLSVD